jgi:undecaprenyl diphosphate synthase
MLKKLFGKNKAAAAPQTVGAVPKHIAFICDGNRRWAKERGLPPLEGHRAGIQNFEPLADYFIGMGVTTLSFFLFSTENWDRSKEEVDFLMNLFYMELKANLNRAAEKNLRYLVVGERGRLPKKLATLCDKLQNDSAENTGGTICLCINYGGQDEIVRAANAAIAAGKMVDKNTFETFMDTGDVLPIDMMVRTSNECRISNFLIWKLAYAELLFVPYAWPEMVKEKKHWAEVLEEYGRRNRTFGGGKEKNYGAKK